MPTILWEKHLVTAHRVQRQCLIGLIEYTTSTTTKCKSFIGYFCEMNFTFSQSFYIWQLLTIDYDCPVHVRQKISVYIRCRTGLVLKEVSYTCYTCFLLCMFSIVSCGSCAHQWQVQMVLEVHLSSNPILNRTMEHKLFDCQVWHRPT